MAPTIQIMASVVDARFDVPRPSDNFVVDTNVLYWSSYTRASQSDKSPAVYQTREYPKFLNSVLSRNGKLHRSGFSFGELVALIERVERELACRAQGMDIPVKEFRHHPQARRMVLREIRAAWAVVESLTKDNCVSTTLDDSLIKAALDRIGNSGLDGTDAFLIESAARAGLNQFISDDRDFCTVPGITVFSCNSSIVSAAQAAKRLVIR